MKKLEANAPLWDVYENESEYRVVSSVLVKDEEIQHLMKSAVPSQDITEDCPLYLFGKARYRTWAK